MKDFDEIFEEYQYANKAEKSIKEFSNWILGISIAICTVLLFKMDEFNVSKITCGKLIYIQITILSLISTLIAGYCKYRIYLRDIGMSIHHEELKKLLIFSKIKDKKKEDVKSEWTVIYDKWVKEFNKLNPIGKLIKISSVLTFVTILIAGLYIIILISI